MSAQTHTRDPKKRPLKKEYEHLRDAEDEMLDADWPEAIHFENFIPEREQRRYIFLMLDRLAEKAPSSANLDITLRLEENRAFQAIIKLESYPEHYTQTYESGSLYNLMDNLFEDMERHFLRWKKERHLRDGDARPR